ncbi:cytochrome P450 [Xylariaceae sp. FL0662B]|nr:cytochrome P450 [Xylariaceae sp. FL0662B]
MESNFSPPANWWPLSKVATGVILVLTLYTTACLLSLRKIHPREPPVVPSPVPLVGHLLGMALQGGKYIKNLGLQNPDLPIFTLPVPNSRIYVVTDPPLAAAVQRASKALSFTPIIPEVTKRVLGLDRATVDIARKNMDPGPNDERGFLADIQDMVYTWLGPGNSLTDLTIVAVQEVRKEVAAYAGSHQADASSGKPVDLLAWVRHIITVSTAKYLYGPENPIALHPELEDAFWDFDHGLGALLINIFPSITARKAFSGREKLSAALVEYLEAGRHKTGSKLIQKRVELALKHGWTLRMTARSELSFLFGGIVNATTSTFWILLHLFADPELLATVREEIEPVLEENDEAARVSGEPKFRLSIGNVKDRCPLLVAVYRECLRLGSDHYSTRVVKENTLLAGRYFLKKGAVIQIAGGTIHGHQRIWGDDAATFNPRRFLDKQQQQQQQQQGGYRTKPKQVHPAAWRPYGGGKTLCPGRHFAENEILSLLVLVLLQFDMNAPGGGSIEVPEKNDRILPVHILEPVHRVKLVISRRVDDRAVNAADIDVVM